MWLKIRKSGGYKMREQRKGEGRVCILRGKWVHGDRGEE